MTNLQLSYKATGVDFLGDIPDHWEVLRLKYRASYRTSNVDKKTKEGERPVKLCNYTDVYYRDRIRAGDGSFMKATASPQEFARFRLNDGDVVITKDSEDWQDIAVPALIEETADDFVCGYHLGIIRPTPLADPGFVFRAMQSVAVNCQLQVAATGITRFGLPKPAVGEVLIPFPPHDEQRAIADYLDTETASIDTLISKKRRLIELLAERRTLAAEDALARLRESETSIPLKYLVNESNLRCGTNQESGLLSVSIHHGVVPKSLESSNQAVPEDLTNYKLCHPGDIIVNRMRAFQGGLGVSPQRGIVSPDYTVLRVGSRVSPKYLHFLMRSSWFVSEMTKRLRGIGATDQGQVRTPRINFADMGLIEVPVPSRDKQDELATDLTRQEAQITQLVDLQKKQLDLLAERRKALITAAVTGEVKVFPG